MKKNQLILTFIIVISIAVIAIGLYSSFAWYRPDSPSAFMFDLVADNVESIYFVSNDVNTTGDLTPAIAMPGAIAEGKNIDVTRVYDPLDPEPSYVSEAAHVLSYQTTFINRGSDTILVEYEWYVALASNPTERLDNEEFVMDITFTDVGQSQVIVPDENNRFYLTPQGESRTIEVEVGVEMHFAKVDELIDPRIKDSALQITIDIQKIWELSANGYMEFNFYTDDEDIEGTFYPEEDPITYMKDFAYTGIVSYLADVNWVIEYGETALPSDLFVVNTTFINKNTYTEIIPDVDGKINIPANTDVQTTVEVSFAYPETYYTDTHPEYSYLLTTDLYVTIAIGTEP